MRHRGAIKYQVTYIGRVKSQPEVDLYQKQPNGRAGEPLIAAIAVDKDGNYAFGEDLGQAVNYLNNNTFWTGFNISVLKTRT